MVFKWPSKNLIRMRKLHYIRQIVKTHLSFLYVHKNIMIVGFDISLCCYFTVSCFALTFQLISNIVITHLIVFLYITVKV